MTPKVVLQHKMLLKMIPTVSPPPHHDHFSINEIVVVPSRNSSPANTRIS